GPATHGVGAHPGYEGGGGSNHCRNIRRPGSLEPDVSQLTVASETTKYKLKGRARIVSAQMRLDLNNSVGSWCLWLRARSCGDAAPARQRGPFRFVEYA